MKFNWIQLDVVHKGVEAKGRMHNNGVEAKRCMRNNVWQNRTCTRSSGRLLTRAKLAHLVSAAVFETEQIRQEAC